MWMQELHDDESKTTWERFLSILSEFLWTFGVDYAINSDKFTSTRVVRNLGVILAWILVEKPTYKHHIDGIVFTLSSDLSRG